MIDYVRAFGIFIRRGLAAAALAFVSLAANATFPGTTAYWTNTGPYMPRTVPPGWPTAAAECDAQLAAVLAYMNGPESQSGKPWSGNVTSVTETTCGIRTLGTGAGNDVYRNYSYSIDKVVGKYCPAGSTLTAYSYPSGTCTCNSGYLQNGSSCTAYEPVKDLNNSGQSVAGSGPCSLSKCYTPPGQTAANSIMVRGTGAACWKNKLDGKNYFEVYGPFTADGGGCTPVADSTGGVSPSTPSTPSPADCVNGYWGSVNGTDVCIPKAGSTGTGSTTSNDGTTTTTDSTGTTTTTTKGETTCNDGICTTTKTTTTTPPGGTATTTTTTSSQPQTSFCTTNPTAVACQAQSDECIKNPTRIGCLTTGTPDNGVTLSKTDSGFNAITAVSFASSSACPANLTFDVMGRQYQISYASMCSTTTTYIAPVVLILGVALAAFVFVGGFKA